MKFFLIMVTIVGNLVEVRLVGGCRGIDAIMPDTLDRVKVEIPVTLN